MHYRARPMCIPLRYVDRLVDKAVDEIVDKCIRCG
jgi:hypothetical protein